MARDILKELERKQIQVIVTVKSRLFLEKPSRITILQCQRTMNNRIVQD